MAALIQFASGAPGIKYILDKPTLSIGRGFSGNDICLPCAFASKHHAVIEAISSLESDTEYNFYIEDLGSTNNTYVNEKSIRRVRLEDGDIIRIGKVTLKFDAGGENSVIETLEIDCELPPVSQSNAWSFSRRLISIDE